MNLKTIFSLKPTKHIDLNEIIFVCRIFPNKLSYIRAKFIKPKNIKAWKL